MPSIGWSEMLLLAVVAIVVVGPKELPRLLRVVGYWMGKARAAAREFQNAFDELARESEMEEMRRKMKDVYDEAAIREMADEDGIEPARGGAGNGADAAAPAAEPEAGKEARKKALAGPEQPAEEPDKRTIPSH